MQIMIVSLLPMAACDVEHDEFDEYDEYSESDDEFRKAKLNQEILAATPVHCPTAFDSECSDGNVNDLCIIGETKVPAGEYEEGASCDLFVCGQEDFSVCKGSFYASGTCHYSGTLKGCTHQDDLAQPVDSLPKP